MLILPRLCASRLLLSCSKQRLASATRTNRIADVVIQARTNFAVKIENCAVKIPDKAIAHAENTVEAVETDAEPCEGPRLAFLRQFVENTAIPISTVGAKFIDSINMMFQNHPEYKREQHYVVLACATFEHKKYEADESKRSKHATCRVFSQSGEYIGVYHIPLEDNEPTTFIARRPISSPKWLRRTYTEVKEELKKHHGRLDAILSLSEPSTISKN